jgi:hypothetical protein
VRENGPGTFASAGQDDKMRLWDADAGREWLALDGGAAWVERLGVSPDGAYLASAAGRSVRLWDRQGRQVEERPEEFRRWLADVETAARQLEQALRGGKEQAPVDAAAAEGAFQKVGAACTRCHAKYRDVPQ